MDKHTILHNVTKTFQSVMDFFNKHESEMEKMAAELEKEFGQPTPPSTSEIHNEQK